MALKMSEIRGRLGLGKVRKFESYNSQAYITANQRMCEVETQKAAMLLLSNARRMDLTRP
jgi:hypothetical protein